MPKSDDPHKQAVYDAEFEVRFILKQEPGSKIDFYGSTLCVPVERKFASIESVETYVRAVCSLGWVQERFGSFAKTPPRVRPRRGQKFAHYERFNNMIAMPPHLEAGSHSWAMRELVVLHELAHHFTPSGEHHGTRFCLNLMDLWGGVIDPTVKLLMMRALDMRKVPLN